MKKITKFIGILLSLILIFSSVGLTAFCTSQEKEPQVSAVEVVDGSVSDLGVADFFDTLFAKIKRAVLILAGNITTFFDGDFSRADYSDYSSDAFAVPGLDEGFIPQGLCYVENLGCFAVSGYLKDDNSRIYLVNAENGEVKELILKDFTKHAGGIASDGDDLWVCAGGSEKEGGYVYHLSLSDVAATADGQEIEFDGRFKTQVRASTICCDGNMLYVAEFYEKDDYPANSSHSYGKNKAWAVGYKLTEEGFSYNGKEVQPDVILSIPDKVQGMAVTAEGNVLFSTSYGRFNDSALQVYKPFEGWTKSEVVYGGVATPFYVADDSSFISKVKMPTLMEGIDAEGDSLYVAFESGADTYSDAKEIISTVKAVDINSLIEKL